MNPPAEATPTRGDARSALRAARRSAETTGLRNNGSPPKRVNAAQQPVGWSDIVDPDSDCKIEHDPASNLVSIHVPGTPHVLSAEIGRLNAPRPPRGARRFRGAHAGHGVFHPSGRATMPKYAPYHGAGVVVWQDERNYLRLEIAADVQKGKVRPYVNYEFRRDGGLAVSRGTKIEDGATNLRLERRGDEFFAAFAAFGAGRQPLDLTPANQCEARRPTEGRNGCDQHGLKAADGQIGGFSGRRRTSGPR